MIYPEICFYFFWISSFFLGPTDFTDFTGDLRLVALVAKHFFQPWIPWICSCLPFRWSTPKYLRIQTFWAGCRDKRRHFPWIPLILCWVKNICCLQLVLSFLPDIGPPLGTRHFVSHNIWSISMTYRKVFRATVLDKYILDANVIVLDAIGCIFCFFRYPFCVVLFRCSGYRITSFY